MGSLKMSSPISCFLCQGLLPPDDEEVFINHIKQQHRVFSRVEFVMAASILQGDEIEIAMEFIKSIAEKRNSEQYPKAEIVGKTNESTRSDEQDVSENDNQSGVSINLLIPKKEMSKVYLKLEPNDNDSEEMPKSSIKRRGLPKGSSFMGKLDKKTEVILGQCRCPLCNQEFSVTDFASERLYRTHVFCHGVRRFKCECEKSWDSQRSLKLHVYTTHRGIFHCSICRCVAGTEEEYKTHIEKHEKKETLICDDCGFTTIRGQTFHQHIRFHHDSDVHICEFCSKEFTGRPKVMVHKRRFHAEKKPCPLCGKMVKSMWIHKKNMHTNNGDKKYQCDECEKGFVEKGKLEIHMTSVHIEDRRYVCRFECGAASNEKGNRKKHEIAKHGQV